MTDASTGKTPLNGIRTHPLTPHAIGVMRSLRQAPTPLQEINAGVVDRLTREHLMEVFLAPSPYRTVKGEVRHARLSAAGEARLAEIEAGTYPPSRRKAGGA